MPYAHQVVINFRFVRPRILNEGFQSLHLEQGEDTFLLSPHHESAHRPISTSLSIFLCSANIRTRRYLSQNSGFRKCILFSSTGLLLLLMYSVQYLLVLGAMKPPTRLSQCLPSKNPPPCLGVVWEVLRASCDLLGASLGSVLGVSHDCSELQNLGNKGDNSRFPQWPHALQVSRPTSPDCISDGRWWFTGLKLGELKHPSITAKHTSKWSTKSKSVPVINRD